MRSERRGEGRSVGCVRAVERRMRSASRPFTRWVIFCKKCSSVNCRSTQSEWAEINTAYLYDDSTMQDGESTICDRGICSIFRLLLLWWRRVGRCQEDVVADRADDQERDLRQGIGRHF